MSFLKRMPCLAAVPVLMAGISAASAQSIPQGYPADYGKLLQGATKEGVISIYSPTDAEQAKGLISGFETAFPGIKVQWNDLSSSAVYNRVVSEAAAGQVGADVVWSNGLDLQLLLVEEGHAVAYKSPEAANLPSWANYKDTAYLTTVEPSVFMYNKAIFKGEPPKNHGELLALLSSKKDELKGKVATFDPEKSAQAFVTMATDVHVNGKFWDLVDAFGAADGKVYSSSGQIREKILSGEHSIGFNVNGAYAAQWAAKNPNLVVVYPTDYTISASRAAYVSKAAPHPNAARVFLDYMLSKPGQEAVAKAGLPSIRSDTSGDNYETANKLASGNLKPIPLDASLLADLEPTKRAEFFKRWKRAFQKQ
ncbi:MAG: transporter substrate-binding protein [Microvirga sp.]|nr:transporter substrate-binding protein [Microvirga sp.]